MNTLEVDWSEILSQVDILDTPPPGYKSIAEIATEIGRSRSHTGSLVLEKFRAGELDRVAVKKDGRAIANYYKPKG